MPGDKFDLGPSLLDEMDLMFRSMNASLEHESKSLDFENTNKKNEIAEFTSKFQRKNSGGVLSGEQCENLTGNISTFKPFVHKFPGSMSGKSRKKASPAMVKQISVKDEKTLNHAIDWHKECSAK